MTKASFSYELEFINQEKHPILSHTPFLSLLCEIYNSKTQNQGSILCSQKEIKNEVLATRFNKLIVFYDPKKFIQKDLRIKVKETILEILSNTKKLLDEVEIEKIY